MPLRISRQDQRRGRPRVRGSGRSGSISAHSASVKSVSYRKPSRLYCRRVVGVHIAGFQVRLQHPLGITATLTTQPLFGTGSEVTSNSKLEEASINKL